MCLKFLLSFSSYLNILYHKGMDLFPTFKENFNNCTFDYIFKNSNIDILDACTHSLALSFSTAFIDVTFLKKGKELE